MIHNILFLHQAADLYGSGRVLLNIVKRLNRATFHPIVVVPYEGPLATEMRRLGIECHILPLTMLSRATLSLRGLLELPGNLWRSFCALDRLLIDRHISIVHSNTLAMLTGPLWARFRKHPHVWHVHEIIDHPRIARWVYGKLLNWFSDRIVCISSATANHLPGKQSKLARRCRIVRNGLERARPVDTNAMSNYRQCLHCREGDVLFTLVGRINRWKGQRLLVEAANLLWEKGIRNFRIAIVGSVVPGQEHFLHALEKAIAASPATDHISIQPFTDDIWTVWDSCDVGVVPSTDPEPFGLVTLEAMAASKPVIAAAHGGLKEIVQSGQTGWLVTPCDAAALADALQDAIEQPDLRRRMGHAGLLRYQSEFTLDRQVEQMAAVYQELID